MATHCSLSSEYRSSRRRYRWRRKLSAGQRVDWINSGVLDAKQRDRWSHALIQIENEPGSRGLMTLVVLHTLNISVKSGKGYSHVGKIKSAAGLVRFEFPIAVPGDIDA